MQSVLLAGEGGGDTKYDKDVNFIWSGFFSLRM